MLAHRLRRLANIEPKLSERLLHDKSTLTDAVSAGCPKIQRDIYRLIILLKGCLFHAANPAKYEQIFSYCWYNVGPASLTVDQH